MHANQSQQSLSGQLNLSSRLAGLEPALRYTDSAPFSKLDLFFNIGVLAWAVLRDRDASEGTRA